MDFIINSTAQILSYAQGRVQIKKLIKKMIFQSWHHSIWGAHVAGSTLSGELTWRGAQYLGSSRGGEVSGECSWQWAHVAGSPLSGELTWRGAQYLGTSRGGEVSGECSWQWAHVAGSTLSGELTWRGAQYLGSSRGGEVSGECSWQ